MAGDEEITAQASALLLTRDHVTLKFTNPETGAIVGLLRFTVTARDDAGLPVQMACEQQTCQEP